MVRRSGTVSPRVSLRVSPSGVRAAAALAALTAAAGLLAGCAQAVDGSGSGPTGFPSVPSNSASAPSASAPLSTAPGTASAGTSSTPPAAGVVPAAGLLGRVMAPPAGAVSWTSSWAKDTTPTPQQFVDTEYAASARADVLARLRAQGLTTLAHRAWFAKDQNQADMVVLRFRDDAGALSRWLSATAAQEMVTGSSGFSVTGVPHSLGFQLPNLDQLGNRRVVIYVPVHNVVIELFYYSPARYQPADAERWLRTQYERLR